MDIRDWLRGLGLEQYAPAFADNAVGWDVLPKLTADDLKEIGIAAVGDRRRLLDAIAALPKAVEGSVPGTPAGAERRQLTVMFCDLVGSTALAARLDPEDMREVIGAYHATVAEEVRRLDGFVAKYMGDGVLAYFGYPQAHEDDAERAVRAGLALVERVAELETAAPLQSRIGIATGLVVVGDLIASDEGQERGVVGDTPNLAARLQALAEPNAVLIPESTRRLLGKLFEYRDLGAVEVKGLDDPVPVWQVVQPSAIESRFEALRAASLSPLVGRGEELDLLLRRWQQAKSGEGQVVLVSGEPGIGKSRLVSALQEHLREEPHVRLRHFCSQQHQDSALHPFIAQLERAAGFARGDSAAQKRDKLNILLASGLRDDSESALIAELLSLPNDSAALNLTPQRKREMLFQALLQQLDALARAQPVLMVFEDAHWIDPTSRELLDLTITRLRRLPVFLVITYRPEFQPSWIGEPNITSLVLNRLGERDVTALVRGLAGYTSLASEVVEEIVERTDGVPLFVEELTKAVLERGAAATLSAIPLSSLSVPATLHASLIARLDRLGTGANEIAQIGSVLGREFSYEIVEAVAQRTEAELRSALDRLSAAGLLFCRGTPPYSSYLFKHALVQDAAYGTLLRGRRQPLHARTAAVLEDRFAELVERQPELLAHHLTGAGDVERAVGQWLKAGQHAAAHSAHLEAIAHLERGIALLPGLADTPDRDSVEIDLQLALGMSSIRAKGMIAPAVREAYSRAGELAEKHHDQRRLFQAVYGVWQHNVASGRIVTAGPLSEQLLIVTNHQDADPGLRLQAHHAVWTTYMIAGKETECVEHCQIGLQRYDPERYGSHRDLYGGHDAGVCAWSLGAQAKWLLGYPDAALSGQAEGLALANQISHAPTLIFALSYAALLHAHRCEPELILSRLGAAEVVAAEQRLSVFINPQVLRGMASFMRGEIAEAIRYLRDGLPPGRSGGVRLLGFCLLAEALVRKGDSGEALSIIEAALKAAEAIGEGWFTQELHHVHSIVLLSQNKVQESEAALCQAIRVARDQRTKSRELRAATSLARLWGEQGRREQARELLMPIYDWFTEGFDTADLKAAKALLGQLA